MVVNVGVVNIDWLLGGPDERTDIHAAVPDPGDGLPGRVRDQPRHDDRERRAAGPRPPAARHHTRPAVDRRRLQPRVRRPRPHGRIAGRSVRSPAGAHRRAGRVRDRQRDRRSDAVGRCAGRHPVRDGRVRRGDLPDDAVDHHQHVPRSRRARQGDRAVGGGDRTGRGGRPDQRRHPARALRLAVGVRGPRAGGCAGIAGNAALGSRIQRPRPGPARPGRPAGSHPPRSACWSTRSSRRPDAAGPHR